MPWWKRLFDLFTVSVVTVFALPLILVIAILQLLIEGRPVFYGGERMKTPTHSFTMWKFRTMITDPNDRGVSGGDKANRITRLGRVLRKTRLDELPQIWNIWAGDMSCVGPRPPLREIVERFPDVYAQVLKNRPGVTGFASVRFSRHETRLLARSTTREETDALYVHSCVPRKARLDLIYQSHQNFCLDLLILKWTLMPWTR